MSRSSRRLRVWSSAAGVLVVLASVIGFTTIYRNSHYFELANATRCHSIAGEDEQAGVISCTGAMLDGRTHVPAPPTGVFVAPRTYTVATTALTHLDDLYIITSLCRRPPPHSRL